MKTEHRESLHPSSAHIYARCPGAVEAAQGLPKPEPDEQDREMAASGTRIHEWLETSLADTMSQLGVETIAPDIVNARAGETREKSEDLADALGMDQTEQDTAERILELASSLIADHGRPDAAYVEPTSLYIGEQESEFPLWRGRMDALLIYESRGEFHVIDYKSGWGEQTPADQNEQLRMYIASVASQWPEAKTGYGHIITKRGIDTCSFDRTDLASAQDEADRIWQVQMQPGGERNPGSHCRYCPALLTGKCPESTKTAYALSVVNEQQLSPAVMSELLALATPIKKAVKRLQDQAKAILKEDPDAIPDWELKPGAQKRTIADTGKAYEALSGRLEAEEYLGCCSVKLGALRDTLRASEPHLTVKAADELINKLLTDAKAMEWSASSPQLKQKKGE